MSPSDQKILSCVKDSEALFEYNISTSTSHLRIFIKDFSLIFIKVLSMFNEFHPMWRWLFQLVTSHTPLPIRADSMV